MQSTGLCDEPDQHASERIQSLQGICALRLSLGIDILTLPPLPLRPLAMQSEAQVPEL